MDLFAALDYSGPENRTSVLLFSVLHHLSLEARDALLTGIAPAGLGRSDELRPQHGVPVGVLDGWLLWSGRCAVVLEAKVDDALGAEQPERYATWLTTRDEPERVLWLATKESGAVAELLPRLKIPAGVRMVHTTWTVLADRAATNAASASEADSLLLLALARRLRSSGAAVPPRPALDRTALGLAVGALPHIRRLRDATLDWFLGIRWLTGDWKREARFGAWVDLSVFMERWLRTAQAGPGGDHGWIAWWVEVYGPARGVGVWPPGQDVGVRMRVGVHMRGALVSDLVLEPLRAALGEPHTAARADFHSATEHRPWRYDRGQYHEVWWDVPFDPFDLPRTEELLRATMAEQAERVGPLVAGGAAAMLTTANAV